MCGITRGSFAVDRYWPASLSAHWGWQGSVFIYFGSVALASTTYAINIFILFLLSLIILKLITMLIITKSNQSIWLTAKLRKTINTLRIFEGKLILKVLMLLFSRIRFEDSDVLSKQIYLHFPLTPSYVLTLQHKLLGSLSNSTCFHFSQQFYKV